MSIDYVHPNRPAGRHAACMGWDEAGHDCLPGHDCDDRTIVTVPVPITGNRWVVTSYPWESFTVGPVGRGAHRSHVSLIKA